MDIDKEGKCGRFWRFWICDDHWRWTASWKKFAWRIILGESLVKVIWGITESILFWFVTSQGKAPSLNFFKSFFFSSESRYRCAFDIPLKCEFMKCLLLDNNGAALLAYDVTYSKLLIFITFLFGLYGEYSPNLHQYTAFNEWTTLREWTEWK